MDSRTAVGFVLVIVAERADRVPAEYSGMCSGAVMTFDFSLSEGNIARYFSNIL